MRVGGTSLNFCQTGAVSASHWLLLPTLSISSNSLWKANSAPLSEAESERFSLNSSPLPARIQNTQVQAEYKDGILNLTLPKAESEKNKVVKVNLEQAA